MRNIKSTLRIMRNSALLFVAASGAAYLTGCSNESDINPDQEFSEPAQGTGSYTVYGSNPDRVRNYGKDLTRATAAESFVMQDAPPVPDGAKEIYDGDSNENFNGHFPAGNYVIPAGKVFNSQFNSSTGEVVFYVKGTLHFSNLSDQKLTIYILDENAQFIFDAQAVPSGITIYNYGSIAYENLYNKEGTIYLKGKLWSLTSLDFADSDCKTVFLEATADVRCKNTITAKNIEINGQCTACAIVAEGQIKMNNDGTFKTSYLKANTIEMNQSHIELDNHGLIWAIQQFEATDEKGNVTVDGNNALLYTRKLKTRDINSVHIDKNFSDPNVKVVYEQVENLDLTKVTVTNIYLLNDVIEGGDAFGQVLGVNAAGCHGAFGPTGNTIGDPDNPPFGELEENPIPEEQEDPDIILIPVADIANPSEEDALKHDHGDISATCISFNGNGVAFASFHRRGTENSDYNQGYDDNKGHKGCIEKIVYESGKFALKSFMIAPEWDFNHIYADGDRVITVGNHVKKGAFIAALPVNFEASTGVSKEFGYKELTTDEAIYGPSKNDPAKDIKIGYKNAGDGNCVVRVGDLYYVTTFSGYRALDKDFKKAGNFIPTTGSSKHIALNADRSNMAIISLDEYSKGLTESTATIKEFSATDKDFATAKKTYAAGAYVAPIDGKNTIAYSGNNIFACLGKGGLVKDGQPFYQRNNAPVNGVAIVGDYIFVANGSFLDVLDLRGNRLCYYHDKNLHSSNFVAVDENGFIYVAFGKSDVKIFKLGGKSVDENWHIKGK